MEEKLKICKLKLAVGVSVRFVNICTEKTDCKYCGYCILSESFISNSESFIYLSISRNKNGQ